MSDSPKEFIKRFIGFSMGPILSAIISFFTVPITTYFVVPTEFGKASMYTMALSISSMFIFLGMDQSFTREFNAEEDKKSLFWNSLIVPLIFSLILGVFYIIYYKPLSMLMIDTVDRYIVVILALSLPFAVIDRFNLLLIRMEEKARLYSLFNVISKVINVVILVPYLLYIDKSFKGIINAGFVSLFFMCIVECFFTREYWFTKFKLNKALINKMFKFGLPLIPAYVIVWFLNSMDKLAMRQWSTFEEIGLYSAAFKIVAVVDIVKSAFCTFWTPTAFRWYEEKVKEENFMKVSNMLMCFMNFMFVGIVLFKDLIIKLLDASYASSAIIVPFLLLLPIMYTVSESTCLGISFSRKTSYNIIVSLIAAVVNYILNYLLVPKYGALGASVATGIAYTVFFWVRTLISRKLWFKFKLGFYILNTASMLLLASLDVLYNNLYINIAISLFIVYINRNEVKSIISYIKMFLKDRKNKAVA
ncbi:polysaccharide biosynthesis protein [Clostridium botulinum]|nr:polysaccharide biosynthesis protein [Clostridium botulinum]NFD34667.1 polysaccharide biosynthesis protein [Clostridium botulinum]NFD60072.1 polysaccharide biosynthesis protein [Clostridium botulinum]NFE01037.1 polysaccharide biosynthesis protein [Clostridium botulinum]